MPDFISPPHGLAQVLICVCCLMWAARLGIGLARDMRGPEQHPPNISLEAHSDALRDRVTAIEKSINEIWNTVRDENTKIRAEVFQFAKDVERAVGRLEGHVKDRTRDS